MEKLFSMNALFLFCVPAGAATNRAALFRRGNHGAREEDAEGNEALAEFPKACSD